MGLQHTFERALRFPDPEVARLLQGGERFVDTGDGDFVRVDVEVADCVVDELGGGRKLLVDMGRKAGGLILSSPSRGLRREAFLIRKSLNRKKKRVVITCYPMPRRF